MIDDDEYLLRDYAEYLEDLNLNVYITSEIEILFEQIENHEYDAAILDIQMDPGKFDYIKAYGGKRTGLLLAKKIRNIRPDIPIVALTTSSLPEMVEWFSQDESVRYFNKREYNELAFAIALKDYLDFTYGYSSESDKNYILAQKRLIECKKRVVISDMEDNQILKNLNQILVAIEKKDSNSAKKNIVGAIEIFSNISSVASLPLIVKDLFDIVKLLF